VTTAAKDANGNALTTNAVWSFTTGETTAQDVVVMSDRLKKYAVLAGTAVTNSGATSIEGDIGVSTGSAIDGFPPGIYTGSIHSNDADAIQAKTDLTAAYNEAMGRAGGPITKEGEIGGQILLPGLYKSPTTLAIGSGDLTLDAKGDANAVWVFQMDSSLVTGDNRRVILVGGAKADNVFWQVGSSATLGIASVMKGNLLASTSITMNNAATLEGRVLCSTGAVTMNANTITKPTL
jgi:hypothetical protein